MILVKIYITQWSQWVTLFNFFCFQGDLSDHFAKFVTTISGVKHLKPLTNGQMKILRNIIRVSIEWLYSIFIILLCIIMRILQRCDCIYWNRLSWTNKTLSVSTFEVMLTGLFTSSNVTDPLMIPWWPLTWKSQGIAKWSEETIISFCRPSRANTLNNEMEF